MSIEDQRERYKKWWVGKLCKPANSRQDYRKVVDVKLYGPPSFVYGTASLIYEDGEEDVVFTFAYKPRKQDVLVYDNNPQNNY